MSFLLTMAAYRSYKGHLDHTITFCALHEVLKITALLKPSTCVAPVHEGSVPPCTERGQAARGADPGWLLVWGGGEVPGRVQLSQSWCKQALGTVSLGGQGPTPQHWLLSSSLPTPSWRQPAGWKSLCELFDSILWQTRGMTLDHHRKLYRSSLRWSNLEGFHLLSDLPRVNFSHDQPL